MQGKTIKCNAFYTFEVKQLRYLLWCVLLVFVIQSFAAGVHTNRRQVRKQLMITNMGWDIVK